MPSVLALDVGSSSVRAQRFDERGEPLDELRQERYDGGDPDEIVELVRKVVDGRDEGVDAVGASCFGHSLLALDEAGRPLTPVLGWRDTRSADVGGMAPPAGARRRRPSTRGPARPSIRPSGRRSSPGSPRREPEIFREADRFVSFCDYLYAELLGIEPVTSLSIASGHRSARPRHGRTWDAGAPRAPRRRTRTGSRASPTSRTTAGIRP